MKAATRRTRKTSTPKSSRTTKRPQVSEAATSFMKLVEQFDYQQVHSLKSHGLTNLTFWAGAGFSKSWDPKAPVSEDLFTLKTGLIEHAADTFALSRIFGFDLSDNISYEQFRQIVYELDMNERYPDIRPRYIDDQNLRLFRAALRSAVVQRYEQITDLNYFDQESQKFLCSNPTQAQQNIVGLFNYLLRREDGSELLSEGIRTHFVTTNYDFVIETILDECLGEEEYLYLYTYRGFTPAHVANEQNIRPVHDHGLTWHLLKINGGFEILPSGENYLLDYSHRKPNDIFNHPPVLMLPSREQKYDDPYFRTIFPKAVRLLRETRILILVGYSLPEDDALIRFILRQFAEAPEDGRGKYIFYIDPCSDRKKRKAIAQVFPMIERKAPKLYTFEGGFEAFAAECIRLLP